MWQAVIAFQDYPFKTATGLPFALYDIYRENQVPGRRRKLLKDMERIFDETHNADVANVSQIGYILRVR